MIIQMLLILLVLAVFISLIYLFQQIGYSDGYKQGQVDAINGEITFVLVEFEDGERSYYEESELKDLKSYKIIENLNKQ